jgi:hypothetical protein
VIKIGNKHYGDDGYYVGRASGSKEMWGMRGHSPGSIMTLVKHSKKSYQTFRSDTYNLAREYVIAFHLFLEREKQTISWII